MNVTNKNAGFTLIEIMVVVVILGILAAIVVPRVMDRPDQARITKAKQDVRALESALNLYRLDNYRYPSTDQGLESLLASGTSERKGGPYMDRLPMDPWGNEYLYLSPGANGAIDIYSLGIDGVASDDDIGNWNLQ